MQDSSKWRRVSRRVEPLLRKGNHSLVWETIQTVLESDPLLANEAELEYLHRVTMLASHYGELSRAFAWIEVHKARFEGAGKLDDWTAATYGVVQMGCHLGVKNYAAAEELFAKTDWTQVFPAPWVLNLLLFRAVHRNRKAEILALLRRPTPGLSRTPDFDNPLDRATRLRLLGDFFYFQGGWPKGRNCLRSALREYCMDTTLTAQLSAAFLRSRLGFIALLQDRLEEAEAYLVKAVGQFDQLRQERYKLQCEMELAQVYLRREEFSRAEDLAREAMRSANKRTTFTGIDIELRIDSCLLVANIATQKGNRLKAERYLRKVKKLLDQRESPRLTGFYHVARGRAMALREPRAAILRALREFDRAETCFRSIGDGAGMGLAIVNLRRGEVNLKQEKAEEALQNVALCLEQQRERPRDCLQSDCLLLKSKILLSKNVPRPDRLYEEVLGGLGLARNPITLFKVVANLYLYSWELDDHLDLMHQHLQQVNRMSSVLDRPTFERLYTEHVTRHVAARAMERTFKVTSAQS